MSNLKDSLIKLGYERKDLREHIRPVLDKLSSSSAHFTVYDVGRGDSWAAEEIEDELKDLGYYPDSVRLRRDDVKVVFSGPDAYDEAAEAVGDLSRTYRNISKAFRGAS